MDVVIIIWGYTSESTLYQFQQPYMRWSQSPHFTDVVVSRLGGANDPVTQKLSTSFTRSA